MNHKCLPVCEHVCQSTVYSITIGTNWSTGSGSLFVKYSFLGKDKCLLKKYQNRLKRTTFM